MASTKTYFSIIGELKLYDCMRKCNERIGMLHFLFPPLLILLFVSTLTGCTGSKPNIKQNLGTKILSVNKGEGVFLRIDPTASRALSEASFQFTNTSSTSYAVLLHHEYFDIVNDEGNSLFYPPPGSSSQILTSGASVHSVLVIPARGTVSTTMPCWISDRVFSNATLKYSVKWPKKINVVKIDEIRKIFQNSGIKVLDNLDGIF